MHADESLLGIKHAVLYEVAKLAFEGELEEKRDDIAKKADPWSKSQFPLLYL